MRETTTTPQIFKRNKTENEICAILQDMEQQLKDGDAFEADIIEGAIDLIKQEVGYDGF